MTRTITILAIAAAFTLPATGCIETDAPLPEQQPSPQQPAAEPSEREDHPDPTAHQVEAEADDPAEEPETLEAGPITGSWKLVRLDTGDQIGQFSLARAKGDPELDGSYAMRYGLNQYFDGISGEVLSGTVDGDRAEFAFNPTPNEQQRFHVQLERSGEAWTGQLWAELDPDGERIEVRLVPLNR